MTSEIQTLIQRAANAIRHAADDLLIESLMDELDDAVSTWAAESGADRELDWDRGAWIDRQLDTVLS